MHAETIKRFFAVQYALLDPICPHFCRYMRTVILGLPATATWPAIEPVDDALIALDKYMHVRTSASCRLATYPRFASTSVTATHLSQCTHTMQEKLHYFRVQIARATVGKPGKAKTGAGGAPVAKATDANI